MAAKSSTKEIITELPPGQTGRLLLGSVMSLLQRAVQVLEQDHVVAQRHIARAVSLLETGMGMVDSLPGPDRGHLAPWQFTRVADFVEANLTGLIRIQDMAALTRLSPSYFSRAFRATTGVSPYCFVIRRRITRAKSIILWEDKPLSQIALDCGLADQAHLTRLFHRIVGTSPSAWRRANRQAGGECGDLVPSATTSFNRVFDA